MSRILSLVQRQVYFRPNFECNHDLFSFILRRLADVPTEYLLVVHFSQHWILLTEIELKT
jgi:hypothetical protein